MLVTMKCLNKLRFKIRSVNGMCIPIWKIERKVIMDKSGRISNRTANSEIIDFRDAF